MWPASGASKADSMHSGEPAVAEASRLRLPFRAEDGDEERTCNYGDDRSENSGTHAQFLSGRLGVGGWLPDHVQLQRIQWDRAVDTSGASASARSTLPLAAATHVRRAAREHTHFSAAKRSGCKLLPTNKLSTRMRLTAAVNLSSSRRVAHTSTAS